MSHALSIIGIGFQKNFIVILTIFHHEVVKCLFPGGIGFSMLVSKSTVEHLNLAYILRFPLLLLLMSSISIDETKCFHSFCDLKTVKNYFVPFDRGLIKVQLEGR